MSKPEILRALACHPFEMKKRAPVHRAPVVFASVVRDNPLEGKVKALPSYDIDLMVRPVGSIRGRVLQTDRVLWSVDVETTGLNHYSDRIVQLAAVPYYPDGVRGPARVWFFDPGVEVSPEAQNIHGLSNEKLRGQPTFESTAKEIFELLQDGDFLGYNIQAFDIRLLQYAFARAGYRFPAAGARVVDAFRIFRSNVTRDSAGGNHRLNTAHKFYCNTDIRDAHDAEADAHATLDVLLRQVAVHREVPQSVSLLHEYSREKRPFARADFYRRHRLPEVPTLRPYIRAPLRISPDRASHSPPPMLVQTQQAVEAVRTSPARPV